MLLASHENYRCLFSVFLQVVGLPKRELQSTRQSSFAENQCYLGPQRPTVLLILLAFKKIYYIFA